MSQLELILENIRLSHIEKLLQEAQTEDELQRGVVLINESMQMIAGSLMEEAAWKQLAGSALIGAGLASSPAIINNAYQQNYSPTAKQYEQKFIKTTAETPGIEKYIAPHEINNLRSKMDNLPQETQAQLAGKILSNPKMQELIKEKRIYDNQLNNNMYSSIKNGGAAGAALGLGFGALLGLRRNNNIRNIRNENKRKEYIKKRMEEEKKQYPNGYK